MLIGVRYKLVAASTDPQGTYWFNNINTEINIAQTLSSKYSNEPWSYLDIWLVVRHGLSWPANITFENTYTFTITASTGDEE